MSNLKEAFLIKTYYKDNVTVPINEYAVADVNVPVIPGYSRAMWWVDCENASSGGVGMSDCNVYDVDITTGSDNVKVSIKNNDNYVAKVKVVFRILYIKSIFV